MLENVLSSLHLNTISKLFGVSFLILLFQLFHKCNIYVKFYDNQVLNCSKENLNFFPTVPLVRIPLSPPFFLPPSYSLNQSQFAQPPLKPVDTKHFTKHIAVCLKHTQTPNSDRFFPFFAPPDSEF